MCSRGASVWQRGSQRRKFEIRPYFNPSAQTCTDARFTCTRPWRGILKISTGVNIVVGFWPRAAGGDGERRLRNDEAREVSNRWEDGFGG
eukprot:1482741-Pleurochrysis_carterae.AAC.1